MSDRRPTAPPPLETVLAELTATARAIADNKRGAIATASTPEGRQKVQDKRMELARWLVGLQRANRALASADQALEKALKFKRWRIPA